MPLVRSRAAAVVKVNRADFTIEVDEPTLLNTGVLPGVTRSAVASLATTAPDQVFENYTVNGRTTVNQPGAVFRNCYFRGLNSAPSPSGITNLVSCTNVNVADAVFEDCTFQPQFPHHQWQNGIAGHDYTLRRCQFLDLVDGVNVFNSAGAAGYTTGVQILQCYFGPPAWWTAATSGVVHTSDTETHNDCIQHMGGTGTRIQGNAFHGYYKRQYGHWMVTNRYASTYTTVTLNSLPDGGPYQAIPERNVTGTAVPTQPTGTEADGRYNWDDIACLMIGDEEEYSAGLEVWGNWFYGGNFAVNGGGNSYPGGDVHLGTFYRNRFDRTQGNQHNSGPDGTNTLNFQGGGWSGRVDAPTTGANANVYMDNGNPVTVRT